MRLLHDPLDTLGVGVSHKGSSQSWNPSFEVITKRRPAVPQHIRNQEGASHCDPEQTGGLLR